MFRMKFYGLEKASELVQKRLHNALTDDESAEFDALDLLEKLESNEELTHKQRQVIVNLLKKAIKDAKK